MTLSPFGHSFFSPRLPLSPPSPFSSLPNSVNLFVCSGQWRTLRELIIDWICLSPFYSPLCPPGHLCLLPPSCLLCITPWTSLRDPDCGEHIRKWLLASLLSPLLIPLFSSWSPLSPSSLFSSLCNSMNISEGSRLWRAHRKWLLASLLSPLLIPLFFSWSPLSPSSLFSSPCNSVNLSGCLSLWRNFSFLT